MNLFLFDIDGTLVRSGGAGKAAMEQALVSAFGVAEIRHDVPFSGRTDRAISVDLFTAHGIPATDESWHCFVATYLDHLPEQLAKMGGRVLPGIRELLTELHSRNDVALGLLTGNIRAGAEIKLRHFDLWSPFAFGGFGDHHHDRDQVARSARDAAHEHLGQHPANDRTWVIGDTPLDVKCARAIGAHAIAVATGYHPVDELAASEPDLLLADLADTTRILNYCLGE